MPAARPDTERYADALLALADAGGAAQRVHADLAAALDILATHAGLRRFLGDGSVALPGKVRALEEILEPRVHPLLLHFLLGLLRVGRLDGLDAVAQAFYRKVSQAENRLAGEVRSPRPLDGGTVERLERETGALLGKEVRLAVRVDPELLGGLLIRVGDFIVDGTIDRQLADIRRGLLA